MLKIVLSWDILELMQHDGKRVLNFIHVHETNIFSAPKSLASIENEH